MKPVFHPARKLTEISEKIVNELTSSAQGQYIQNMALLKASDINTWKNNKAKLNALKNLIRMMLKLNKKEGQVADAIKHHNFKSIDIRYAFIDDLLDEGILKESDFKL